MINFTLTYIFLLFHNFFLLFAFLLLYYIVDLLHFNSWFFLLKIIFHLLIQILFLHKNQLLLDLWLQTLNFFKLFINLLRILYNFWRNSLLHNICYIIIIFNKWKFIIFIRFLLIIPKCLVTFLFLFLVNENMWVNNKLVAIINLRNFDLFFLLLFNNFTGLQETHSEKLSVPIFVFLLFINRGKTASFLSFRTLLN